jgi:dTMP kinase
MFITFEGLDFSGKTTQAQRVVERLRKDASGNVVFLREPGGTKISERVREILLDKRNLEMSDMTELLLFAAGRAQVVREVIRPALEHGDIVICDRFLDSTTAYQGFGRGLDRQTVKAINHAAIGETMPDLTIFVDIPVSEIGVRKERAGLPFDRMESSGQEFYERVRAGYRSIALTEPDRVEVIDGMRGIDDVWNDVWNLLVRRNVISS